MKNKRIKSCLHIRYIFVSMLREKVIFLFIAFIGSVFVSGAQDKQDLQSQTAYLTRACVYKGDTIPYVPLPDIYVFKPLKFKKSKDFANYQRLIRDVKKVYPIAREINSNIIETYEYLQTIPTEKGRKQHIKKLEKGLKEQYTPRLKKLSLRQGKLLIKLIDRENNQTSYELVKAFLGSFKAGFYQMFASVFGASLKKHYDPEGEDKLTERVILMVKSGQL